VLDIMTIHFYSIMVGFGLAILTVVGCLAMLLGWFFYLWREASPLSERRQTGS
jgi:hypothetical protein